MWIWVLSILGLILIWAGGFGLGLIGHPVPFWVQLVATLALALTVGGVFLWRRWRARKAARALERELLRQSEQQVASVRPDRRAEVLEIQRRMQQGIDALKKSKLGTKGGGAALYALPWYVIIGPPGAGKTTALRHSGLTFPFVDPTSGGGVKGTGGTRNCDWWFTSEAILLDTAGRFATDNEDKDEWFAFLASLKKFRTQAPINGVIVAVSLAELMEGDQQHAFDMAKQLRARVDEIINKLDVVLPVYLMFTKADLVSGFVEFWGDLRKSERDQVFGASFALDSAMVQDPGEALGTEFDRLITTLHSRTLRSLPNIRQPERRQRMVQYALEVRGLRETLVGFVGHLFQRNSFQENPIFRGFYLSSGTQEGRPLDRVVREMAEKFGLPAPVVSDVPVDPKSYFVTNVFRRVMFPDQDLVRKTASARQRELVTSVAFMIGGVIISTILLAPAGCSYAHNQGLIEATRDAAKLARLVKWTDNRSGLDHASMLEPVRTHLVEKLNLGSIKNVPFAMRWWGMYVGDKPLYPALRDAYVKALDAGVVDLARADALTGLKELSKMESVIDYGPEYQRLKLYLMMTKLGQDHMDVEWAADRLIDGWAHKVGGVSPTDRAAMRPHALLYVQLRQRDEIPAWSLDQSLVTRSRTVLLRAPQLERMFEVMVAEANQSVKPVVREDIFPAPSAAFVTSPSQKYKEVAGAYTKDGWALVKKLLGSQKSKLVGERWVLGETVTGEQAEAEKEVARLRDLYFTRYQKAWREFLMDMDVSVPKDSGTAIDELNALSEEEWPYQRLLRILAEHVRLDVEPESEGTAQDLLTKIKATVEEKVEQKLDGGAPGGKKKPQRKLSPVEIAFKPLIEFAIPPDDAGDNPPPTRLSQYQNLLKDLVGTLTDIRDSHARPDTTAIAKDFEAAFRTTSGLLASQSGFTRPILSPYLLHPITGAWTGVVNDSGGAAGGLWEVSVWQKWHDTLEKKYPFTDSREDAKLEDFVEFFKPDGGTLWGFFNENLKGSIDRSGEAFVPSRRFAASIGYTNDFLSKCLKRGAEITTGTFPPKSEGPTVSFDVNLHSVSEDVAEVSIEIDGVAHVYKNTPEEWLATRWPAKEPKGHGAKIRVRGYNGLDETIVRTGPFGFFRMLDAADEVKSGTAGGKVTGSPTLVATWRIRSEQTFVKLDIRPERSDSAMSAKVFRDYNCPRVIARAGTE